MVLFSRSLLSSFTVHTRFPTAHGTVRPGRQYPGSDLPGLLGSYARSVLGQPCPGVSSLAQQGLHMTASATAKRRTSPTDLRGGSGPSVTDDSTRAERGPSGTGPSSGAVRTSLGRLTLLLLLQRRVTRGTVVVPPDVLGDYCTNVDSSSVEGSLSEQRSSYTVHGPGALR